MVINRIPSVEGGQIQSESERQLDVIYMRIAYGLASASGIHHGKDVPIAAVGVSEGTIIAHGIASDNLLGDDGAHAEGMMIRKASVHEHTSIKTVYTTFEPCILCLNDMHEHLPDLETVIYGNERTILERKGDVNPRQSAEDYAAEVGLPFEVRKFDADPRLSHIGESILHSFERDRTTGAVHVDAFSMVNQLRKLRKLY